ncbi:exodeoxyribonuclease III [Suttonella ornithocola]|uniref:Exodeoxyribonuclease n=1 Tax=Suttonella ornithocola TaxID=279832 RepID=A0A380MU15_9GAMM|nr:exodeoxyribonuclease III [Suttonella ornithocola]SUO95762.1 Exodeoxyribonuclease [Suttonella ornithocola]
MFKIITFNANGIRAAERKGFFHWLATQDADAVCIQETKAQLPQLEGNEAFFPLAHNYYHDAEKKGYSGTALYLKHAPDAVKMGIGWPEIDSEGRYLEARYGRLHLISLYMHSGTSGDHRQTLKEDFMAKFLPYLTDLVQSGAEVILCGDINIAHTEKDIRNWKGNLKNSGFLPHERQWLTDLFAGDYKDAFRLVNNEEHQYTWWSQRGKARINNVGWRIDYQIISNGLADKVIDAEIYTQENFSDHAPLIMTYQDLW